MRKVIPMELGLVFWAEQDASTILQQLKGFGIGSGQLGVPPTMDCKATLNDWSKNLNDSDINISGAVCCYQGEDYSNLEIIHETVGFTTERFRAERIARTKEISDFAHALGLTSVSCHLGFIPDNQSEPLHKELSDLTKLICDHCAKNGQSFVLETGQESAEALLAFIDSVDRPNLKVNFDPANMILYNSGEPLAALQTLSSHVLSVHCKDAHLPAGPGLLGAECPLGEGDVDFPGFLAILKQMNYQGALSIEREEPNAEKRIADIKTGVTRLKQWKADLGL